MPPPERITVATCIGCGAMSRPGSCDTGCTERRLELVRAAALDGLADAETTLRADLATLSASADELRAGPSPGHQWPAAYAQVQKHARQALQDAREDPTSGTLLAEPAEPAITWWCERCDGVDAPQPCLGICVWRPVDWARLDIYDELRERAVAERDRAQRLRGLLQRLVHTTPHTGQHERSWQALAEQASGVRGADALSAPATTRGGPRAARRRG
ncbi:MAG TPA: hypothetical protein VFN55_12465 [Solirubrobacteraceae bacterium]|nr:hypothetical protein [Solirubrobacteraceae bacterium]